MWGINFDCHIQISIRLFFKVFYTIALNTKFCTRCCTRWYCDCNRFISCWNFNFSAIDCLCHSDWHFVIQIVAFPYKKWMSFNIKHNNQSAVLTTIDTNLAFIHISNCLSVVNASWNSNRNNPFFFDCSSTTTSFALFSYNLTTATTSWTLCSDSLPAKNCVLSHCYSTCTITIWTSTNFWWITCSTAFAVWTFFCSINFDWFFCAFDGLLKSDIQSHSNIIAVNRHICTTCSATATKKLIEDVFKAKATKTTSATTEPTIKLRAVLCAVLVIVCLFLWVGQNIICVVDFLKSVLCLLAFCLRFCCVSIRMIFHYSLTISRLNFLLTCTFLHTKQIIIILFCHK